MKVININDYKRVKKTNKDFTILIKENKSHVELLKEAFRVLDKLNDYSQFQLK